jgi:hypothetical protein
LWAGSTILTLLYTTEGVHSREAIADLFAEVKVCWVWEDGWLAGVEGVVVFDERCEMGERNVYFVAGLCFGTGIDRRSIGSDTGGLICRFCTSFGRHAGIKSTAVIFKLEDPPRGQLLPPDLQG